MTRPLRIALACQEYPPYTNWGGIATANSELAKAFSGLGHEVVVVSRFAPGAPAFELESSGVSVWRVGGRLLRRRVLGRTVDRMMHARDVYRKVRELDAARPFDVIEVAELGLDGERLLQDAAFSKRVVIQCHGGNVFGQGTEGIRGLPNRLDFAWSLRRELDTYRRANRIFIPSEATRRALLDYGVLPSKMTCIPHGVDTDRFRPAPGLRPGGTITVGFVGRLERLKGIDFLWKVIDAVGPNAGVRFRLKGAIHPMWRAETIEKLSRFSGYVEHVQPGGPGDMPAFYQSLDVLLQPSQFENFGLAYVEGMATGLVVFAGRGGAGPEVVTDGVTGFLVDPDGQADGVVAALRVMVTNDERYAAMRQAARDEAVRRFSVQRCAQAKIDAYLGM